MFCKNCGVQMADGSAFCAACGAPQNPAPAPEQAAPQQPQYQAPPPQYQAPQQPQYQQPQQQYGQPQYQQQYTQYMPNTEPHHGSVGFGDAIKLYFQNYANFTGRASKSEYWWAFLFTFLVSMVAAYIPVLGPVINLALLIPNLSIAIRRLHDTGKSWVYYLMGLIPFAGFIIMIVYYCQDSDGDNQWGPGPVNA